MSRGRVVLESIEGDGFVFRGTADNGRELVFDTGPDAVAVNPVQTVLLALGGCTGMDVIGILRKKRQVVTGYEILLEGERRAEHPRIFTRITLVHRLTGRDLSPAAIEDAIRLSETRYCSVTGMLAATATITSRFEIVPA